MAHHDGLSSLRALTDSTGSLVQTYRTDAFGVPTATQGSSSQSFQFTGEQLDPTGLVNLRTRIYDPGVGRFLQRDANPGSPANPLSLNRFAYGRDNPINLVDPDGTDPLGVLAHQWIEIHFLERDPTWEREVRFPGLNNGSDIIVDLVQTWTNRFYEIKPVSEISAGRDQIAQA